MKRSIILLLSLLPCFSFGVEQQLHGLVDLRFSLTDSIDSYLSADYGKFASDDGSQVMLGQAALSHHVQWGENFSSLVIANGYTDNGDGALGFSEAYLQYKGLPSENGYRFKVRAGTMYPKISVSNVLTGWSSPYTLNYSMINSWIAEEIRLQGLDFSLTRLARLSDTDYDFEISAAFFQNNDPAGSMLAWHGWVQTSRQSLLHESLPTPNSDIRFVANESDVFLELDHNTGYHLNAQWTWQERGKLLLGYYDNRGNPRIVENRQYAWDTHFLHIGTKWRLDNGLEIIAQLMDGDYLMQNPRGTRDLVNNDFQSAYLMLSKKIAHHRVSGRLEKFSVDDNDTSTADLNQEDGLAVTLNHSYRLNKNWYFLSEINWIESERPSRLRKNHREKLTEQQLQFAIRYFF